MGVAAAVEVVLMVESEEEVEEVSIDADELDTSSGETETFKGSADPEACEV